jgi:hypothetical protein
MFLLSDVVYMVAKTGQKVNHILCEKTAENRGFPPDLRPGSSCGFRAQKQKDHPLRTDDPFG